MDGTLAIPDMGRAERPVRLVPIKQENITKSDVSWLEKAAQAGYNNTSARELVLKAMHGEAQLWRLEGLTEGILVTVTRSHSEGNALWVEYIAGKELIKNKEIIWEQIKQIARALGCFALFGIVWDKELAHEVLSLPGALAQGIAFSARL